jgi:hypothetical protein
MPKIEFRDIAVQVLFAAMLIDAFHAALEHRIVALRRVDADLHICYAVGIGIFLARVINHVVRFEVFAKITVDV